MDEFEESAIGLNRDDIERNKNVGIHADSNDIFIVSIEYPKIVFAPVVGGSGDDLEPERDKPVVDPIPGHGDEIQAGLRDTDRQVILLDDDSLEAVQARADQILQAKPLQILIGRSFPEMESSRILVGGNESQIDAGSEAEDTFAGELDAESLFLVEEIVVLLPSSLEPWQNLIGI